MRFKVDENLPIDVAELLRANGHDAMTIFDQQMVGELDPKVASVCKAEERTLITLDLDFSDIRTYPPGASRSVTGSANTSSSYGNAALKIGGFCTRMFLFCGLQVGNAWQPI